VSLIGARSGAHVKLSWNAPNAASYQLKVARDGAPAQVLVGATTSTSAAYDLEPGHIYAFSVSATDVYGATMSSSPYVVELPISAVTLSLRAASARKGSPIRLWAIFSPQDRAIARGGRTILLESFDGRAWHRFGRSTTTATGVAKWAVRLRRGTHRLRVRFQGAAGVAPATSSILRVRTR
jgi:hypothetical protein